MTTQNTHERDFDSNLLAGVEVRHYNGQCPYGPWLDIDDAVHVPKWVGEVIADQIADGDESEDMIVSEGGDQWMWRRAE